MKQLSSHLLQGHGDVAVDVYFAVAIRVPQVASATVATACTLAHRAIGLRNLRRREGRVHTTTGRVGILVGARFYSSLGGFPGKHQPLEAVCSCSGCGGLLALVPVLDRRASQFRVQVRQRRIHPRFHVPEHVTKVVGGVVRSEAMRETLR